MYNRSQIGFHILDLKEVGLSLVAEPDVARRLNLLTGSLQHIIWSGELAPHACLDKVHKMLGIIEHLAGVEQWPQPRMCAKSPYLVIFLLKMMGDIQMNLVCQANNLSLGIYRVGVHQNQVYVGCTTQ